MAEILAETQQREIQPVQCMKDILDYLSARELGQVLSVIYRARAEGELLEKTPYIGFKISAIDLVDFSSYLAFVTLHFPNILVPIFEEAILKAQMIALESRPGVEGSVKNKVKLRIHSLPPVYEFCRSSIGQIRSLSDSNALLEVSGTVVRTGAVRLLEKSKTYQCMSPKCLHQFKVYADSEQGNVLSTPRGCAKKISMLQPDGSEKLKTCPSTNIREVEGEREVVDYQEIKIQDCAERLPLGSVPRSLVVVLEADLVDQFNPGDDVIIVGTILRQWRPVCKGVRCEVDIALRAQSARALNAKERASSRSGESLKLFTEYWSVHRECKKELLGRNNILRAVCPQLYGLYGVKLALLLTLIGGSDPVKREKSIKENNPGALDSVESGPAAMRTRCQSHLLLVGDPGTGKSQVLRFAASVIPRSVITTGIGTTGSGLTCTAVKEGSDWCIEAGALVLANEGVCCIDEFASIKEQDRATIHEAMEQQTLSVAKAGLVVKLNTRTTVIAACNPKGNYDLASDITTNTAIASPLLSRFDLVLLLLDRPDKEYDKRISTYLLKQATDMGKIGNGVSAGNKNRLPINNEKVTIQWDINTIRDYISFVREKFHPVLSPEAAALVQRFYQIQRQSDDRSSSRTTVRLLESLVRLTCAHAKLMCRSIALLQDAVVAVAAVASSQSQLQGHVSLSSSSGSWSTLDIGTPNTSTGAVTSYLHYDFPENPDEDYLNLESQVLLSLHCTKDSLTSKEKNVKSSDELNFSTQFSFLAEHTQSDPVLSTNTSVAEPSVFFTISEPELMYSDTHRPESNKRQRCEDLSNLRKSDNFETKNMLSFEDDFHENDCSDLTKEDSSFLSQEIPSPPIASESVIKPLEIRRKIDSEILFGTKLIQEEVLSSNSSAEVNIMIEDDW